jgi:hypothetical protein
VNRFLEPLLARIRVTPLSTDLLPSVDASAATAIGVCFTQLNFAGDSYHFHPFASRSI